MAKGPDNDLFAGTTMSFGEHLEELRGVLFRSLIGLVVGFVVGLGVARAVVIFMEGPLKEALEKFYLEKALEDVEKNFSGLVAAEMLTTIREEELIPDVDIKVELDAFLRSLKAVDPAQFKDVNFSPHRFVPADVIDGDYGGLCARLKKDGTSSEKTPGKQLWELMDEPQRNLIEQLAGSNTVTEENQISVLALLNRLADKPEVHRSQAFQDDSDLKDDAVQEIRQSLEKQFDADQSRRLNKLLISTELEEHLRKPRVLLVNIPTWKPTKVRVQSLGAHEAFMIWLKAGFVSGLIISSPWIFWQIWTFVGSGLYAHEKKYVYIYIPFSLLLFIAGASLAFFGVFQPVLKFLFGFNKLMEIDPDPRISEWLSFVLILPLGFGVSFQLPLVMLFLNRVGVFSVAVYLSKWRIAVLVIFVISMLLTPADPISMLLMALPLTVLYFGGVALCKWMPRGRNPFDEVYEP